MRFENLGFLGIAKRAIALVCGETAVENSLARGKAKILLIAENASERTTGRFEYLAEQFGIKVLHVPTKEEVGEALGVRPVAVMAITDGNFARGFIKSCKEDVSEENGESSAHRKDTGVKRIGESESI